MPQDDEETQWKLRALKSWMQKKEVPKSFQIKIVRLPALLPPPPPPPPPLLMLMPDCGMSLLVNRPSSVTSNGVGSPARSILPSSLTCCRQPCA